MKKGEDNSFGVASFILGAVGSVFGILIFPVVLSILGLIFGIIQYKQNKNKWAIWGIIISSLGILISIYVIIQVTAVFGEVNSLIETCKLDPTAAGCEQLTGALLGQ